MESRKRTDYSDVLPLLGPLAHQALNASLATIESLGDTGKDRVTKSSMHLGKSSDLVLRADIASEKAMFNVIDAFGKYHGIYFRVRGEELGWTYAGDFDSTRVIYVYLDGIDGTEIYANGLSFDAGPMISICPSRYPRYKDTYASGCALIDYGWVLVADSYSKTVKWYDKKEARYGKTVVPYIKRNTKPFLKETELLGDDYATKAAEVLHHAQTPYIRTGSTACTIMLLALYKYYRFVEQKPEMSGNYASLIVDQMDKGELEQPVLYHIMYLLGGEMRTLDDIPFDDMEINTSGSNATPPQVILFSLTQNKFQMVQLHQWLKSQR